VIGGRVVLGTVPHAGECRVVIRTEVVIAVIGGTVGEVRVHVAGGVKLQPLAAIAAEEPLAATLFFTAAVSTTAVSAAALRVAAAVGGAAGVGGAAAVRRCGTTNRRSTTRRTCCRGATLVRRSTAGIGRRGAHVRRCATFIGRGGTTVYRSARRRCTTISGRSGTWIAGVRGLFHGTGRSLREARSLNDVGATSAHQPGFATRRRAGRTFHFLTSGGSELQWQQRGANDQERPTFHGPVLVVNRGVDVRGPQSSRATIVFGSHRHRRATTLSSRTSPKHADSQPNSRYSAQITQSE